MFVTSDIYDLKEIGRFRDFEWSENLLGGIDVRASRWPGREAAARFLIESAKLCGLWDSMEWAGYSRAGVSRTRPIVPRSFERMARGEIAGAVDAVGVLLTGSRAAPGAQRGYIFFGGEVDGGIRADLDKSAPPRPGSDPTRAMSGSFIFPLDEHAPERARELFGLALEFLGAEYGYYFVRDALCFPGAYPYGIAPALDYSRITNIEAEEIGAWQTFAGHGPIWSVPWPLLRDLYQINLLSERHTTQPIEGLGLLPEWIQAQPGRGRLEALGPGRLLWTLTDAEIFNTRPLLNKAGLLRSCLDRVYRDLPRGASGG